MRRQGLILRVCSQVQAGLDVVRCAIEFVESQFVQHGRHRQAVRCGEASNHHPFKNKPCLPPHTPCVEEQVFDEDDWLEEEEGGCAGCMKTFNFHLSNLFSILGLATQVRQLVTWAAGAALHAEVDEVHSCVPFPFLFGPVPPSTFHASEGMLCDFARPKFYITYLLASSPHPHPTAPTQGLLDGFALLNSLLARILPSCLVPRPTLSQGLLGGFALLNFYITYLVYPLEINSTAVQFYAPPADLFARVYLAFINLALIASVAR